MLICLLPGGSCQYLANRMLAPLATDIQQTEEVVADITVLRPRKTSTWVWIVVGLLVLGWLIYALAPSYGMWQARARLADPITDVEMILSVSDHEELVGKNVALDNVRVTEVTGPRTFWVVAGLSAPLLIVLDEPQEYSPAAGQTVDLRGTIRRFPGWEEARAQWNLDPSRPVEAQRIYVSAQHLTTPREP